MKPANADQYVRLFADLLDLPDSDGIGAAIARRTGHMSQADKLNTVGYTLGALVLLVQEIRNGSTTGADLIQQVRNGIITDLVAGTVKDWGKSWPA